MTAQLRFLHLSDIHFRPRPDHPERDVDTAVRTDLLNDLGGLGPAGADIDAVLVVGDLAARGSKHEFDEAREFLNSVCEITGCDPRHVVSVPGNHDIDRNKHGFLHDAVRTQMRAVPADRVVSELERAFVEPDAAALLHAPLEAYNDFAGPHGFTFTESAPVPSSWDLRLEDRIVRIRGVNSTLICDATDSDKHDDRRLVLGANQLAVLSEDHAVVSILMCHHPRAWLRDGDYVDRWLARPHILLTGHEHRAGVIPHPDGKSLTIESGAVTPPNDDPNFWAPAYNILTLRIERPELIVALKMRTYGKERTGFVADPDRPDPYELRIPIERGDAGSPEAIPTVLPAPPSVTTHQRELIFAVMTAPPDLRERAARAMGMLESSQYLTGPDDEQALLRRAVAEGRLEDLAREMNLA